MENATKALLIAAAILVAIIIIGIVMGVVTKGQEQVQDVDLSGHELTAFNAKFKNFEGTNRPASDVRALLSTVMTHNQSEKNGNTVTVGGNITMSADATSIPTVDGASRYTVTLTYTSGRVTAITIN